MKGKIIFYLAFVLLLLTPKKASAEEPDNSGYIITLNNDTVKGLIMNVNLNQFTECEFRKDENSPITKYLPGEIQSYRFTNNGKFFITRQIFKSEQKSATLFLEYLIKGRANIYFMRDNTDHYYMQKDDGQLFELSEPPVLTKNEDGVMYYKPTKFTGKMKYLLSDCPEIFSRVDNTKLNTTDLINLAKDYHNKVCDSARCIVFERKIYPIKIKTGFVVGLSNNDFYFNKRNYTDRRNSFNVGVKVEFENVFFSLERATLSTGLLFQHFSTYNFNTEVSVYKGVIYNDHFNGDFNVDANTLKIPVSVSYMLTQRKLRPYFGLGVTNIFYLSQNPELFITDYTNYFGQTIPSYHMGINGFLGLKYYIQKANYIFFEINLERQQNLNPNLMLQMISYYYAAHIGYMF